jgi:hypothetical protein
MNKVAKISIGGDMVKITGGDTITTSAMTVGSVTFPSANAISTMARGNGSLASQVDLLDKYEMNQLVVEHKISALDTLKIREIDTNFVDHIKQNLTKHASRKIIDKMSFTKSKNIDSDSTTFRGRIWVFTKEELNQLIQDAKNA